MVGKEGGKEFGRNVLFNLCCVSCFVCSSAHGSRAGINLPSSTGRCMRVGT